ncbi:MAG: serine/threonine-protein phosphatase, partial [Firmicutes bacterium]|nr:serine/threonine-protein phosphatase [Bacillota bacterium]
HRRQALLLCTDGLSKVLADAEVAAVCRSAEDIADWAPHLVQKTIEQGAPDNVTVVIVGAED